ncbi:hypothetical protein DENSPDRAFT_744430, partial [Dentipellis sp. KUC8613]
MFRTLLSSAASRMLDMKIETGAEGSVAALQEDTTISLNVEVLYSMLPAVPHVSVHVPWRRMAGLCGGTLEPVYRAVQNTLGEDVENIAQLLAALDVSEVRYTFGLQRVPDHPLQPEESSSAPEGEGSRNVDDCSPENTDDDSLVVTNADPSIPTIVITPCDTQPRESSCWVPFQDACFGNRLVVPAHPVVNDVYPPLLARPLPLARKWEYANGHWRAVLPSVDEQIRRGLFSRVLSARRRTR